MLTGTRQARWLAPLRLPPACVRRGASAVRYRRHSGFMPLSEGGSDECITVTHAMWTFSTSARLVDDEGDGARRAANVGTAMNPCSIPSYLSLLPTVDRPNIASSRTDVFSMAARSVPAPRYRLSFIAVCALTSRRRRRKESSSGEVCTRRGLLDVCEYGTQERAGALSGPRCAWRSGARTGCGGPRRRSRL
jgi:hypothetical protein